jgi:hypothetical protein
MEQQVDLLNRLFYTIRNENVVFWIGSGFSRYAGLPSAKELAKKMHSKLDNKTKSQIALTDDLSNLSEDIERIKKNRIWLNSFLRKELSRNIKDITFHSKLKLIPQIKTIITTNYDNLIEKAYNNNIQVHTNKSFSPSKSFKVELFKVHGDIYDENSIIITKGDYIKFYQKNQDAFWNTIKERIQNNPVVFIGYDFEDPNIVSEFKRISDELKTKRKEIFLIAPKLSKSKTNHLESHRIKYLNYKGEEFIDQLIYNLNQNIKDDFTKGVLQPQEFIDYCKSYNISPKLSISNEGNQVDTFNSIKGSINGILTLGISDKNAKVKINDFVSGKVLESINLSAKELTDFNISLEGIKFIDKKNIKEVIFKRSSKVYNNLILRLDNGQEQKIKKVEFYDHSAVSNKVSLHIFFNYAKIVIRFKGISKRKGTTINFSFEHDEKVSTLKEEIEFYSFLKEASSGRKLTVFEGVKKIHIRKIPKIKDINQYAISILSYFKVLHEIELKKDIVFNQFKINDINDYTFELAKLTLKALNGEVLYTQSDRNIKLPIESLIESPKELIKNANKETFIILGNKEKVKIHGTQIDIGYLLLCLFKPVIEIDSSETNLLIHSSSKKESLLYSNDKEKLEQIAKKIND